MTDPIWNKAPPPSDNWKFWKNTEYHWYYLKYLQMLAEQEKRS